jgi:hypothetical protein
VELVLSFVGWSVSHRFSVAVGGAFYLSNIQ